MTQQTNERDSEQFGCGSGDLSSVYPRIVRLWVCTLVLCAACTGRSGFDNELAGDTLPADDDGGDDRRRPSLSAKVRGSAEAASR
jgi:hypothetical protein